MLKSSNWSKLRKAQQDGHFDQLNDQLNKKDISGSSDQLKLVRQFTMKQT